MQSSIGRTHEGIAGTATEVIITGPFDDPNQQGTVACWFLHCPRQSPAWEHYQLSVVHLRPIDGGTPPVIVVPGATHEVLVCALSPDPEPVPTDPNSWRMLNPVNVCEQVQLPNDAAAVQLAHHAAWAVTAGTLPAEPPLSGAVEPWRTWVLNRQFSLRGTDTP